MGTRGYYVLRYRNFYFAKYNHHDSYPEGFGLEVLRAIRQSNALATQRQMLGEMLDKLESTSESISDDSNPIDGTPSRRRPINDIMIEWIYEVDLDHNIFHINGMPFFSLECLPDDDDFLEYISEDHYGYLACASECPPEHKYKKSGPPVVDNSDLATYQSFMCTGSHMALSNLLAISDVLSPDEHVRVSLLEVMIGTCMVRMGEMIYEFEIEAFNHSQLTDSEWSLACFIASIAFVPQIFNKAPIGEWYPELSREEFTWVREDTVIHIATHLDDERCLQASMTRLIKAILEQKDNPGDYFGVAFSVYHCAIIKVVKDAHTTTFSHTDALQFLPSFFADSPSTPGITALARLAYRADPALFVRALKVCHYKWRIGQGDTLVQGADNAPPNINCPSLPLELWQEIALHLHLSDLLTFGLVSKLCREAASMVLRYPHICGYRLVAIPKEKLPDSHLSLRAAAFSAVRSSAPADVLVGIGDTPEDVVKMPLKVGGYLMGVDFTVVTSGGISDFTRKKLRWL
ncbi:uncharacterized protein EDB91DRAFT_1078724 [Suillus paluster]|uniref:uncharacterized protein n=1 Tax=Suillus paluster TaxID=48578 RepID=UPI001B86DD24|nr:uncharacterized protein EDB91DRAFT_1078724 [Suillus paluster]KAG1749708.1 hypothetical protein EDB91DRAFT_1078724 [Suillus paluster]